MFFPSCVIFYFDLEHPSCAQSLPQPRLETSSNLTPSGAFSLPPQQSHTSQINGLHSQIQNFRLTLRHSLTSTPPRPKEALQSFQPRSLWTPQTSKIPLRSL